jgi:hypothetical protein
MSLIFLPIMAGLFVTCPDEIFKNDNEIDKMSIELAKDDIAAKGKKNSFIFDDAFESDI